MSEKKTNNTADGRTKMQKDEGSDNNGLSEGISTLERIMPLAQQVNCLDIDRIANVCIENIPKLVGVKFVSLYILEDGNNILHSVSYTHLRAHET